MGMIIAKFNNELTNVFFNCVIFYGKCLYFKYFISHFHLMVNLFVLIIFCTFVYNYIVLFVSYIFVNWTSAGTKRNILYFQTVVVRCVNAKEKLSLTCNVIWFNLNYKIIYNMRVIYMKIELFWILDSYKCYVI